MMKPLRAARALLAFALALAGSAASAAIVEEIVNVPVEVRDIYGRTHQHALTLTVFRDPDSMRSPFLVVNHGRSGSAGGRAKLGRARYTANSQYFVRKGFAVFVPTRVGYGVTGGPDVEYSGSCARRNFRDAFEAGVTQSRAVIEYAKAQSFVDPERGLVAGQSVGGAITVALASVNVPGVLGAINFAGGAGGDPESKPENPCSEPALKRVFGAYGETSRIPVLWLYSENDRYWGKDKPHAWFEAFRARGAAAEFVQLPAHRADGHGSFTANPDAWRPAVEKFLAALGFAAGALRAPVANAKALP